MSTTKWDHCKEIINTALGLGFTSETDRLRCDVVYAEIDGDFGLPTCSDLTDFKLLITKLPGEITTQAQAKVISILALNLYEALL